MSAYLGVLLDLLERLKKAKGPDRELDACLWEVTSGPVCRVSISRPRTVNPPIIEIPRFTDDLHLAMILVERCLPAIKAFALGPPPSSGWKINLYRGMTPTDCAHVSWYCSIRPHAGVENWCGAPTAALAVLCALLFALNAYFTTPFQPSTADD